MNNGKDKLEGDGIKSIGPVFAEIERREQQDFLETGANFDFDKKKVRAKIAALSKKIEETYSPLLGKAIRAVCNAAELPHNEQQDPEVKVPVDNAKKYISAIMNHEEPAVRRLVPLAYLTHHLSLNGHEISRKEIIRRLDALVAAKAVVAAPNGDLRLAGRSFSLPEEMCFSDEEMRKVEGLFADVRKRLSDEEQKAQQKAMKAMPVVLPRLTIDELLAGKPGYLGIDVPPMPNSKKPGYWLAGGRITVVSEGGMIRLSGVSRGESLTTQLTPCLPNQDGAKELVIPVSSIGREKVEARSQIRPQERFYALLNFFNALNRGIRLEQEYEQMAHFPKAKSANEVLRLRQTGVCLAEFNGEFEVSKEEEGKRRSETHNPFLLLERTDQAIIIRQVPSHLNWMIPPEVMKAQLPMNFSEWPEEFGLVRRLVNAIFKQLTISAGKVSHINGQDSKPEPDGNMVPLPATTETEPDGNTIRQEKQAPEPDGNIVAEPAKDEPDGNE